MYQCVALGVGRQWYPAILFVVDLNASQCNLPVGRLIVQIDLCGVHLKYNVSLTERPAGDDINRLAEHLQQTVDWRRLQLSSRRPEADGGWCIDPAGRNQWMTDDEVKAQTHTFVKPDDPQQMNKPGETVFVEARHDYSPADY